ncbi:innexin shaking-B [Trichonephila inaurata madagascariensis]|uniref:Innexin n=1 Tax=Trichonephila inaurata madagascariensis TaxID=2747483 RepID=A0A8X6J5P1_9ARAC|nr:innexin shaking-B [Trichonephila inaurata madagascariensis]
MKGNVSCSFIISRLKPLNLVPEEVPHPGIASSRDPREYFHLKYYQWVYIVLLLQAFLFYIPRWLWKQWEGGKMEILTKDMGKVLLPEPQLNQKFNALSGYLVKTWSTHDAYAGKYFFCELLSFIVVIGQFFILDIFFDGRFMYLGTNIIKYYHSEDYLNHYNTTSHNLGNPMLILFPRVAKCIFRRYGRTQETEVRDVLCVMTLNVINEKFFVFLWYWFVLLATLTAIALVMDFCLILSPPLRVYALKTRFFLVDERDFQTLIKKGTFGDWFVMEMIGLNIDQVIFKDLITDVAKKITDYYKTL